MIKIFISVLFIFLSNLDSFLITQEGYGNFILGKTTLESINTFYPSGQHSKWPLDNTLSTESIRLKERGIELFFTYEKDDNLDSVYLHQIDMTSPCTGKTEKNIGIGSSIEEVIQAYGNKPYLINEKEMRKDQFLNYKWIIIYTSKGNVNRISISSHSI